MDVNSNPPPQELRHAFSRCPQAASLRPFTASRSELQRCRSEPSPISARCSSSQPQLSLALHAPLLSQHAYPAVAPGVVPSKSSPPRFPRHAFPPRLRATSLCLSRPSFLSFSALP